MLASLFSQLSVNANQLLVTHVLYLYQKHLADFFLDTQQDFNSVMSIVFTLFGRSSGSDTENNPVTSPDQIFSVSVSVLEKYFDLFKEEASERVGLYMIELAPKIFGLLMEGVDTARDVRYFECIEKFIK